MAACLLVRSLERTVVVDVDRQILVHDLKRRIEAIEGIPENIQSLAVEGRILGDSERIDARNSSTVVLNARLRGGKGGFGSLMRAYAAKLAARARNREEDVGAMRDLNGRRIRHVQAEKKITEWQAQEHKIDHSKLQKTFTEIGQGRFPTADKGKCKFGVNCKYKWKCKYTHPDDEARRKAMQPVKSISENFGEAETNLHDGSENIMSAVKMGLERSRKRKRGTERDEMTPQASDEEDDEKKDRDVDDKQPEPVPESTKDAKNVDKKQKTTSNVEGKDKPSAPRTFGPVDLKKYSKASDLEALGLEHLKHELQRVGLKCGGNIVQRSERLFLLKAVSYEDLPKKVKAKRRG
ncbi:hypothetical protein AAMO2058_001462300 [Amorphochlora amoebiformis]